MTSTLFTFDEPDPPLLAKFLVDPIISSFLLLSGELDFDAYVEVSPPLGHKGDDDVDMTDTVDMLNCINMGSCNKGLFSKLVRILMSSMNIICRGSIGGSN